jgi:hypothetical protein
MSHPGKCGTGEVAVRRLACERTLAKPYRELATFTESLGAHSAYGEKGKALGIHD